MLRAIILLAWNEWLCYYVKQIQSLLHKENLTTALIWNTDYEIKQMLSMEFSKPLAMKIN